MARKKKFDRTITFMVTNKMYNNIKKLADDSDKEMSEFIRFWLEDRIRRLS